MKSGDELSRRVLAAAQHAARALAREVAAAPPSAVDDVRASLLAHVPQRGPGRQRSPETWERYAALTLLIAARYATWPSSAEDDPEEVTRSSGWQAIEAGDVAGAERTGDALLAAATDPDHWNYGNLIHDGHIFIGYARFLASDNAGAARELHRAGTTPGSPQLASFGPDLTLAWELMRRGQDQAALAYFKSVARFWKPTRKR